METNTFVSTFHLWLDLGLGKLYGCTCSRSPRVDSLVSKRCFFMVEDKWFMKQDVAVTGMCKFVLKAPDSSDTHAITFGLFFLTAQCLSLKALEVHT